MSETDGQEEPTMEEILASIRRIISEDDETPEGGEDAPDESDKAEEEPVEEPAEEPVEEVAEEVTEEPEPAPEPEPEVLELTEEAEEEVVMEEVAEEEPEPEPEKEPEPEPQAEEAAPDLPIDDVDPAEEDEILVSEGPALAAMGQFSALSDLLTKGYQGSGNTLEDLVRELLKPMLREWLDQNLPPVVERMVAKEIARLARIKKP